MNGKAQRGRVWRAGLVAFGLWLAGGGPKAIAAEPVVLLTDGFGDGDHDNDGGRAGPVDDRSDFGAAWYRARGINDFDLRVVNDQAGIGAGNALDLQVTRETIRLIGASFPEVTLAEVGDRITLRFDVRFVDSPPAAPADRVFRFGLYHDAGQPLTEDSNDPDATKKHRGYFVQMDLGPPEETTADIRGNDNGELLGGSYNPSYGASTDDAVAAFTDQTPRTVTLTVERCEDDDITLQPDDLRVRLSVNDEELIDRRLSQGRDENDDPVTTAFNAVYFGTSKQITHYRLDNVLVTFEEAAAMQAAPSPPDAEPAPEAPAPGSAPRRAPR